MWLAYLVINLYSRIDDQQLSRQYSEEEELNLLEVLRRTEASPALSISPPSDPLNLLEGVVANEFFDPKFGRTGGFGMSTNMVGNFFRSRRDLGVDVVFIFMEPYQSVESRSSIMHELLDWPLISMIP